MAIAIQYSFLLHGSPQNLPQIINFGILGKVYHFLYKVEKGTNFLAHAIFYYYVIEIVKLKAFVTKLHITSIICLLWCSWHYWKQQRVRSIFQCTVWSSFFRFQNILKQLRMKETTIILAGQIRKIARFTNF